jgi:homoserine kinase
LGGGFDCVGIAVDPRLHLVADLPATGAALALARTGSLATLDTAPVDDLIVAGFRAACARAHRAPPPRVAFHVTSEIPVGRGLGSSAAAIVAGAGAANELLSLGLSRDAIIALGAALEGHPDNVAPAVRGGAVLAVPAADGQLVIAPLHVHASLRFVFAVPDFAVDTHRARAALPRAVSHADARAAAAASAALVAGLERGDPALLGAGLHGPLHVPYRRPLVMGYDDVERAARAAGAIGATLSGSGSSVVAIASAERAPGVAGAMAAAWATHTVQVMTFVSSPSARGVETEEAFRAGSRNIAPNSGILQ